MTLMRMRYGFVACKVLRIGVIFSLIAACSTTKVVEQKRTLPPPLITTELPERPDVESISPTDNWSISVEEGDVIQEGNVGILMSTSKAIRAAKYVIAYDELRGLYVIDLRTWGRERDIYQRELDAADGEIKRWKRMSERSWWERNAGPIGVGVGFVLGAALTVGILEATEQVTK